MGRKPKNLKRTASQADLAVEQEGEEETVPAFAQVPSNNSLQDTFEANTLNKQQLIQPGPNWSLDFSPSLLATDNIAFNFHELPVPSAQHPSLADIIPPTFLERSSSTSTSTPGASGESETSSLSPEQLSVVSEMGDPETTIKL